MKEQLIEKVRVFREAFGFSQPEEAIHYKLTLEETDELVEAIMFYEKGEPLTNIADALADRVFTASGGIIDGYDMSSQLDKAIEWSGLIVVDLPRAVDTVFESNMSKLCSRDEITPTADKYAAIGVAVHFDPVDELDESAGFRCICTHSVKGTDGKEYPAGKLLKSVGYQSPDWSYLG